MDLGQGWNIEPKQLLRLRILDWLAAQPMNNIPNVTDFQAADGNRHQLDDHIQALQEFDGLGWLDHH